MLVWLKTTVFLTFRIKFAVTVHLVPFVLRILKSIYFWILNIWPGHLDLVLEFFTHMKIFIGCFFRQFFFYIFMFPCQLRKPGWTLIYYVLLLSTLRQLCNVSLCLLIRAKTIYRSQPAVCQKSACRDVELFLWYRGKGQHLYIYTAAT